MRGAPCAFFPNAFDNAAESARTTHGHPTGYLAAGLFADILARIWSEGITLATATRASLAAHGDKPSMEETRSIIEQVLALHDSEERPTPTSIEQLGGGWNAEEALAIRLWCALGADSLEEGVIAAVNHSGDSDSTGLIAGHFHGPDAIPPRWLEQQELRDVVEQVAWDIIQTPEQYQGEDCKVAEAVWQRYPGW